MKEPGIEPVIPYKSNETGQQPQVVSPRGHSLREACDALPRDGNARHYFPRDFAASGEFAHRGSSPIARPHKCANGSTSWPERGCGQSAHLPRETPSAPAVRTEITVSAQWISDRNKKQRHGTALTTKGKHACPWIHSVSHRTAKMARTIGRIVVLWHLCPCEYSVRTKQNQSIRERRHP